MKIIQFVILFTILFVSNQIRKIRNYQQDGDITEVQSDFLGQPQNIPKFTNNKQINLWFFASKKSFRLLEPASHDISDSWDNDWQALGLTEQCYQLMHGVTGHCGLLVQQDKWDVNPRSGNKEQVCEQHEMFTIVDLSVERKNYTMIDADFCSELKQPHRHDLNDYSWENRPQVQYADQLKRTLTGGAPEIKAQWIRWRNDSKYEQLRPQIKNEILFPLENHQTVTRKMIFNSAYKQEDLHHFYSSLTMNCQNQDKFLTRMITGHDVPTFNISIQDTDQNNFFKVWTDYKSLWQTVMRKIMDFKGQREDEKVVLVPVNKKDKLKQLKRNYNVKDDDV